jgi:transposase
MPYRPYPPAPSLEGLRALIEELPPDHLARLIDTVVDEVIVPALRPPGKGNVPYDPRVCLKVLVYGYATGTRSTRQLERLCRENLAYLFLARGYAPSYGTLCTVRREEKEALKAIWVSLFTVAERVGLTRLGHVVVDGTKLRAHASKEAVLGEDEYAAVRQELEQILARAEEVDAREDAEGYPGETALEREVAPTQMRDIVRQVRQRLARDKAAAREAAAAASSEAASMASVEAKSGPKKPRQKQVPEPAGTTPPASEPEQEAPEAAAALTPAGAAVPASGGAPGSPAPEEAAPAPTLLRRFTRRMIERVKAAVGAIAAAEAAGLKHLCLTDADARMMPEGREKKIRECHSFAVATDNGLLVAAETSASGNDNARLGPILEVAAQNEPEGVKAVTADSGCFDGDEVGRQIRAGVDMCIPDSNTACDLHRHQPIGTQRAKLRGSVELVYDAEANLLRCPEGNELVPTQSREHGSQQVRVYRAKRSCEECPLAEQCLTQPGAKHRTVKIGEYDAELAAARQRFAEPEHQERYRHRGEKVEGVFGFVRGTLGYTRWVLRGNERVACEGELFQLAYQVRKVHGAWANQQALPAGARG